MDDCDGLSSLALGAAFTDADDGDQARSPGRQRLAANLGVGFMMVKAALRVPHDDRTGAGILEHFGGQVARKGARRLAMAVLRPDCDPAAAGERRKARDQGRGRANQNVAPPEIARTGNDLLQLGRRPLQAVHLPIAGYERGHRRVGPPV